MRIAIIDGMVYDIDDSLMDKLSKFFDASPRAERVGAVISTHNGPSSKRLYFTNEKRQELEDKIEELERDAGAFEQMCSECVIGHNEHIDALGKEIERLTRDNECKECGDCCECGDELNLTAQEEIALLKVRVVELETEGLAKLEELEGMVRSLERDYDANAESAIHVESVIQEIDDLREENSEKGLLISRLTSQNSAYISALEVKDGIITAKLNEIERLKSRLSELEDVIKQAETADHSQAKWVREQYYKVQSYVLRENLHAGHHDDSTHADIIISEHAFQARYGKNMALRAQAAEDELLALKRQILWADECGLTLAELMDSYERMGLKMSVINSGGF